MERQAASRRRPRKASAPVRTPRYWPNLLFYRQATQHILNNLTPADVRCLIRLLDSTNRAGDFQLVFPATTVEATAEYLTYFRAPGYYNLLTFAYLDKYKANSQMGEFLSQFRVKNFLRFLKWVFGCTYSILLPKIAEIAASWTSFHTKVQAKYSIVDSPVHEKRRYSRFFEPIQLDANTVQ
ncbi:unnamed protein product [Rodentolepis nana]|uniref:Helitron_like_N domain-containing protein n=1 Tax=Rodentolepis nana TaxID=102285 RepID=A0A0R3TDZ0_RODNA|nr:unnamed protein product [Rodentolepis nana]